MSIKQYAPHLIKQGRRLAPAIIASFLIAACQPPAKKAPPVVTDQQPTNAGKPMISSLVDLGGFDIPLGGGVPGHFSDQRYSPGEWVLIQGKNLGVNGITIDKQEVPITKYYGSKALFQIPTGLSPRVQHTITLTNEFGSTSHQFDTKHYIVATDTDGQKTHLISTNRKEKGGIDEDWTELESEAKRPLFNLISANSAFLFHMDVLKKSDKKLMEGSDTYPLEIHTYHLGAPEEPAKVSTHKALVGSTPIDAVLNDEGTLLLLGKQSITLVDTTNPKALRTLGHTPLPFNDAEKTTYVDAIFLEGNSKIAVLETHSNTVLLFDAKDKTNLVQLDSLPLLPSKSIALSVDLEPDPKDPSKFWVLEGPNYRLTGSKLAQTYKKLVKKEKISDDKKSVHQLQQVVVQDGKMKMLGTVPTPEKYAAYFSVFGQDGRMYVTTTKMSFLNTEFDKDSKKNILKKVKSFLWDTVSFGRVIAIDTETQKTEVVSSGVGVYYHIVDIPDIGPAFSLLKFGPALSLPYLSPNWGVGIKSTGTYAKRKMNKRAVFPPYSVGFIAYQF